MTSGVDDLGLKKTLNPRATYFDLIRKIKAVFFNTSPSRLPRLFVGNLMASSKKNSWPISLSHPIQAQDSDNRVGRCEVPIGSVSMENSIANTIPPRGFGAPTSR